MDIPDKVLLSKICFRHLYLDKQSQETFTEQIKFKYKLAGNPILNQYLFHVLTTRKSACKKGLTLEIEEHHWDDRSEIFTSKETSYCDVSKTDVIDEDDLVGKIRDENNGFAYCAKLCRIKHQEFDEIIELACKSPRISDETKKILIPGFPEIVDKLSAELGLDN